VRRLAADIARETGVTVEVDDAVLGDARIRYVDTLLRQLASCLVALSADALGEEALRRVARIRVAAGAAQAVVREGDAVVVRAPGGYFSFTDARLRDALESAL
jgi:hypothetical protein